MGLIAMENSQNCSGVQSAGNGDYQKAIEIFSTIQTQSKDVQERYFALRNMGICYELIGQPEKALNCYSSAMQLIPGDDKIALAESRDNISRMQFVLQKKWVPVQTQSNQN
jgi:tetratricopeptide (TPR) repeat protein